MTKTRRLLSYPLALFAILLLPCSIAAQSASGTDQTFVDELVAKMALKHQLIEAPEEIRAQFEQNPLQLPTETNKQMLQQFDEAYATNMLVKDFKSTLQQKLTDPYRNKIIQWFNDDYTTSITDARQFYYTLQGKRQRVITRYEMDQDPAPQQRIDLIRTLTDTTSVAEASVESSVIIVRSIIKAIGQLSNQRNFNDTQINAITNNFRSQIQAQTDDQLNREQLLMYHHAPDEALHNYISFWGTNTGQWLDKTISQSMQTAYQQAADRFLQSINSN